MARIRTIKPEFWDDEHMASLPMGCRLFYIGCLTFADDQGVFNANPAFLKSRIFPYDEELKIAQVKEWLALLEQEGMIIPFTYKRDSLYIIRTFSEHQNIDKRYFKRTVPEDVVASILGIDESNNMTSLETTQGTHSDHAGCSTQDSIIYWIGKDSKVIVNGGGVSSLEEQEEFYSIMFFRNMKQPKFETERFVSYNNGKKWKGNNGAEWNTTEERKSLAMQWKPNEQGERCSANFLAMWHEIYLIVKNTNTEVAMEMLDERAKGGFTQSGAVIYCKSSVSDFIKKNSDKLSPIIAKWSGEFKISYKLS